MNTKSLLLSVSPNIVQMILFQGQLSIIESSTWQMIHFGAKTCFGSKMDYMPLIWLNNGLLTDIGLEIRIIDQKSWSKYTLWVTFWPPSMGSRSWKVGQSTSKVRVWTGFLTQIGVKMSSFWVKLAHFGPILGQKGVILVIFGSILKLLQNEFESSNWVVFETRLLKLKSGLFTYLVGEEKVRTFSKIGIYQ